MATLLLAGLLAHEQARDLAGVARSLRQALSLLFFGAACLAKEVALAFPLLVILWDATGPARESPRRRAMAWVGAGLVAAAAAGLLALSPRYRWLAGYSAALRPPGESALANARAVPEMLSLWIRPWALSVDHAFDAGQRPAASALGAAFLAALASAAWAARRRAPLFTLAVGWALVAIAPTNSIVGKIDLVTEKPLYLAWFGPSLLLGAIGRRLLERAGSGWPRRMVAAGPSALLIGAGITCMVRAATWRDGRLLWSDAVAKAPADSRAWNNLGMAYFQRNRYRDARVAFERALSLEPGNTKARLNMVVLDALHRNDSEEDP
jgi:tetratricopeptide (TPR) repeat protein